MSDQHIFPGTLQEAFRTELQSLEKIQAVKRLWAEDPSLWSTHTKIAESFKDQLHWLRLPDNLGSQMERVVQAASRLQHESFDEILFVAMGRSNLAVETITRQSCAALDRKVLLLDSTSPDAIRAIEKQIDLRRTLFIFASKSGKRIETHALLLYFMDKLKVAGITAPGHQFIALTETNSYLYEIAKGYHFREIFLDPPGISSQYSSLIHFNLLLSAVCKIPPPHLLERAITMRTACSPQTPSHHNPALQLAAFLGAAFSSQFEKLVFLNSESLDYLAYQMGSLVGTSTGKQKSGIIPIFGQDSYKPEMFHRSVVIALKLKDASDESLDPKIAELRQANIPLLSIEIPDTQSLGAELFKWEIATVLFCAHKGIDPFTEPDAKESRQATTRILEQFEKHRDLPLPRVRVKDSGIELRMEGETRQQVSSLSMPEALRTFLELRPADGYLALLPFSPPKPSTIAAIRILRDQLVERLAIPVLATSGPRYLHLLGQVYKGGPPQGLFLLITAEPLEDLPIPGAGYTFRQLDLALALGDFETLVHHKRPVLHLHLTQGIDDGLAQLNLLLKQALDHLRFARS